MMNLDFKNLAKNSLAINDEIVYENESIIINKLYYFNQENEIAFYELNLLQKNQNGNFENSDTILYQKI